MCALLNSGRSAFPCVTRKWSTASQNRREDGSIFQRRNVKYNTRAMPSTVKEDTRATRIPNNTSSMSFQYCETTQSLLQSVDFKKIAESSTGGGGLARPFGEFHACRQGDGTAVWFRVPASASAGELSTHILKKQKDGTKVITIRIGAGCWFQSPCD